MKSILKVLKVQKEQEEIYDMITARSLWINYCNECNDKRDMSGYFIIQYININILVIKWINDAWKIISSPFRQTCCFFVLNGSFSYNAGHSDPKASVRLRPNDIRVPELDLCHIFEEPLFQQAWLVNTLNLKLFTALRFSCMYFSVLVL